MNEALLIALIAAAVLAFVAVVFAVLMLSERRRANELTERLQTATVDLAREQQNSRNLEDSRASMGEYLRAQAAQSAQVVAEQLVTRASETFRAQDQLATARLEAQLKPVAETLAKFEAQVVAVEKARADETGGLKAQIAALMQASADTQTEARRLSSALRRGAGVQGRWGEQTLRNVLETAGLSNRFDFEEQFSIDTDEGRRRPE